MSLVIIERHELAIIIQKT